MSVHENDRTAEMRTPKPFLLGVPAQLLQAAQCGAGQQASWAPWAGVQGSLACVMQVEASACLAEDLGQEAALVHAARPALRLEAKLALHGSKQKALV